MRDVSSNHSSLCSATAVATLVADGNTVARLQEGRGSDGEALIVARTAAVLAAKNTPLLLPDRHQVALDSVDVSFRFEATSIVVRARIVSVARTDVAAEALVAATIAALNLYEALRQTDETMRIEAIELLGSYDGRPAFVRRTFRAGIVVASDRSACGLREDATGPILESLLREEGGEIIGRTVVPDEVEAIREAVARAAPGADFLFVAGGTGIGPRDVTPEAILPMLERRLPGVEEHLRAFGQRRLPTAMLSRSIAGLLGSTLVIALPGSPGAAKDTVAALFPHVLHALDVLAGGGHE